MVALRLLAFSSLLLEGWARSVTTSNSGHPGWEAQNSFGHSLPISHDGREIPNYKILGQPHILSDRIVLTPPVPGNQRSALWNTKQNQFADWEAELLFRTSGPERAGGSFHVWYTSQGSGGIGTSTVYLAKPFDGLAIVVDSFGGRSGSLRAFLNDGTHDYSLHHQPQSLAFGHCDLNYRNLGILTMVKIYYSAAKGLRVTTNDKLCFETEKVKLPGNYYFGVSAASAENPDSFEVFGFKVKGAGTAAPASQQNEKEKDMKGQAEQQKQQGQAGQQREEYKQMKGKPQERDRRQSPVGGGGKFEFTDTDWTKFKTQDEQFKELHDRLQWMTHQIAELQKVLQDSIMAKLDTVKNDVKNDVTSEVTKSIRENSGKDAMGRLENKISTMDRTISQMQQSIKEIKDSNVHQKIEELQNVVKDHHSNLLYSLPNTMHTVIKDSGPRIGMGITILVVFQAMLAIAYILYKRRRAVAPKKFL